MVPQTTRGVSRTGKIYEANVYKNAPRNVGERYSLLAPPRNSVGNVAISGGVFKSEMYFFNSRNFFIRYCGRNLLRVRISFAAVKGILSAIPRDSFFVSFLQVKVSGSKRRRRCERRQGKCAGVCLRPRVVQ